MALWTLDATRSIDMRGDDVVDWRLSPDASRDAKTDDPHARLTGTFHRPSEPERKLKMFVMIKPSGDLEGDITGQLILNDSALDTFPVLQTNHTWFLFSQGLKKLQEENGGVWKDGIWK